MWLRAGFNALAAHIAVLGAQDAIVAVNAAWERFGRAHQAPPFVWTGVGLNYLEVCRQAAAGSAEAQDALGSVSEGRQAFFAMEYPCHEPGTPRWFLVQASALPPPHRGLVLARIDITARK